MRLKYIAMATFAFKAIITLVATVAGVWYFGIEMPDSEQVLYAKLLSTPGPFILFGWINISIAISNAVMIWCLDSLYFSKVHRHLALINGIGYTGTIILGVSNFTSVRAISGMPEGLNAVSPEILATFRLLDVGLGSMAILSILISMLWMLLYAIRLLKDIKGERRFAFVMMAICASHLLILVPYGEYMVLACDFLWCVYALIYFKNSKDLIDSTL